ncbi:MAG TPA: DMT family transporter [Candidatus Limnocylindrales bacterium]|nr:DMT family transporter [Candidatus Limnocylindrales bacterium]
MIAIVGGLGAALSWAFATLSSSRSSRLIGPFSVIAWVMTVGFVVSIGFAIATPSGPLGVAELAGLFVVGVSYNVGLLCAYAALRIGRVSIVAPIIATEGAGAAVISVVLGEHINVPTTLVLAVITFGVVLAAVERSAGDARDPHLARAIGLSLAAAASFSIGLVIAGRLGATVPPIWVVASSRIVGVAAIALPLLLVRRLRLTRPALPFVVVSGVLEAIGSGLYVIAAHDGVAAAAVLSSQFAAIAAVGGFVLFGERLQRVQVAGVGLIAIGVTALAAVHA